MNFLTNHIIAKESERQQIERDLAAFFAQGGIPEVPTTTRICHGHSMKQQNANSWKNSQRKGK